ncbi:Uncharacterised protein [BD1-7 clade bacterium]|uniref:Lipoprotein n=1 Tax=BD1-7 clade bacterium TaxID=2029982 RepID=A0A5S9QIW8_9GAMM|nr:Uncharacterised protein [BD1-7 clade bacterium]
MKSLLSIPILFLVGCTSNLYLVKNEKNYSPAYHENVVCVTNPELGDRFQALVESEIYEISDDPNCENKLTFKASKIDMACGNPLIASAVFLGTVPVSLPVTDRFRYIIENEDGISEYVHFVEIYERTSIWEWFLKPFSQSKDELLIQGLKQSERRKI